MTACENDQLEYPLNQIYFYLTEGCNLLCRHCWIAPKYQSVDKSYPVLDLGLFRSTIQQARPLGLSGVKLTGGEPLLHPYIHEILEVVRSENLCLTVETNGTLCTLELAEKMATCKNPFVAVSLDGADAETHEWVRGVEGSFEDALKGIRNLVKTGFKPQIIMSVMKCNRDQIKAIVCLAESLGAGSVKFNLVQPIARGERLHKAMETLTIEELVEFGRWVENSLSASTSVRLYYGHPPAFRSLERILENGENGYGVCRILSILGILSDGSYTLCGIGKTVPELVFGNASKDRLEDIWNNTVILNKLRKGLPERLDGICGDCLMKKICLGNCTAMNYYSSKNLWTPFWYCVEAEKVGLFPETRKVQYIR